VALAVVTGAARGLGKAIATRLSTDGHEVVRVDLAAGPGVDAVCDVTDADAVHELASPLGPVGILVNNAGIWRFSSLLDMPVADAEAVLRVNLLGALYCCQAFVPGMATTNGGSGGAIVNLSSAAAATRSPGVGMYPASKAALEALTRQMALEFGPVGVRVNAVGPGLIVTEGTAHNYEGERREQRAQAVPLRRIGEPRDIADVVAFLTSDDARYVTGQIVYVDGGVTAGRTAL
jgi:3-oxoacyl-[acyl-carrier protein] reductase